MRAHREETGRAPHSRSPMAVALIGALLGLAACGGGGAGGHGAAPDDSGGPSPGGSDGTDDLGGQIGAGGDHLAACDRPVDAASPVLANGFAADAANTRRYPSRIDSDNVSGLEPALVHVAPGVTERRGAAAVTEQTVYLAAGRDVVAMDRMTGCEYWRYRVPDPVAHPGMPNAVRSSAVLHVPATSAHTAMVVVGDAHGTVHALDAADGSLVWSRFAGTDPEHHIITGAPRAHDGTLIVPVSSREVLSTPTELLRPCCTSHGIVRALDMATGAVAWTYHTTADAARNAATGQFAPSGATVWGAPAIDTARSQVIIGTGQNLSHPTTETSDAVIALDLDTGERRWLFQATANDAWNAACFSAPSLSRDCGTPVGYDFDFGAPPIVAPGGAGDRVLAGSKNGVVYALDPDSGGMLWQRRIGVGGALGGIHWGMAVDDERVYAAVADATVDKSGGGLLGGLLAPAGITPVPNGRPGIYALDIESGAVLWERHPRHTRDGTSYDSIHSAALTVTNDVLFAGSLDGVVRALRTSDGETLWSFDTARSVEGVGGVSGQGGEIDSVGAVVAGGDVLVNSGYDTFGSANAYQAGPGNALYVFRLPVP